MKHGYNRAMEYNNFQVNTLSKTWLALLLCSSFCRSVSRFQCWCHVSSTWTGSSWIAYILFVSSKINRTGRPEGQSSSKYRTIGLLDINVVFISACGSISMSTQPQSKHNKLTRHTSPASRLLEQQTKFVQPYHRSRCPSLENKHGCQFMTGPRVIFVSPRETRTDTTVENRQKM